MAKIHNPALRAILVLFAAIVLLDGMGVLVKLLLPRYTAQELSVYRNLIGVIPSLVLLISTGELRITRKALVFRQWRFAMARGVLVALAQLLFFYSLISMNYATVSTIIYSVALFSVAFSVPILGEKVGPIRWAAVFIGFIGVVMVIGPGSDAFSFVALLPLAAAALYAMSGIAVRLIDKSVSNGLIYLYSAVAAAIGAVILALTTAHFSPIASWGDVAMIVAMGLLGGSGVLLLMLAYRQAAPSVLAPFTYFGIISAFSFGWLLLGEAPFDQLFPGVVLIVAGGLLIVWWERKKKAG
jgi:drug/metabolite transporter (DMT)-like permease